MGKMMEKHQAKKGKLSLAFADLERAFDSVPRDNVFARIWIFFPKKELFKLFRELFAKER